MLWKRISLGAGLFFFAVVTILYASVTQLSDTYICDNTGNTILTTYVSTSTIIPGIHKILSVSVSPRPNTTNPSMVAIYDATSSTHIRNVNLKGECESLPKSSNDRVFPYPKHLSRGLAIVQSPYTIVTVEYTR